jgi:hypothetical protein
MPHLSATRPRNPPGTPILAPADSDLLLPAVIRFRSSRRFQILTRQLSTELDLRNTPLANVYSNLPVCVWVAQGKMRCYEQKYCKFKCRKNRHA